MNRRAWKSVVGFLTLAGSFAMTAPASATLWRNHDVSHGNLYLTIPVGASPGQGTYDAFYNGTTGQGWLASADPAAPGFFRIVSGESRPGNQLVLDIPSGVTTWGTRINIYTMNGGANQSWQPVFRFTDPQGASCYSFHSRLNNGKVMMQQGNAGSPTNVVIDDFVTQNDHMEWCAYILDNSNNLVPQSPPPF